MSVITYRPSPAEDSHSPDAGLELSAARLLTAPEVADRLRVTTGWVYAASRANRLPHVRLGRYVRFRADAIERWVADLEERGLIPSRLPN